MRLNPSLYGVCLVQTVMALAVLLKASPAESCSPPPSPSLYYTFTGSLPGDGETEVSLDGVVLLTSRAWRIESKPTHTPEMFENVLTVTVTDGETGVVVPGKLRSWWGAPAGVAWQPDNPLLPNRRYELVGELRQSHARPAEAQGPTALRETFSTGTQVSPPLELLGGLDVSLESFEKDKLDCGGPYSGSCDCRKVGTERGTRARVRVPEVRGGAALGTYHFELWISDRTPYRFDEPDQHLEHDVSQGIWGVNSSGGPAETLIPMPEHDDSYTPCFAWRVRDPAGHILEGTPVCLKETVEPPGLLGCAVAGGTASTRTTAFLALLGTLTLMWRVRRRWG
ncbi:hypothetical protein JQX13_15305 [Archangium violaceum]|uniref:hypothetical protein n=1 Tax=Archangium violaceum TaxID=83451 RepID=UPI00193AF762|nr:hypothetical protein [Archangium violaceum]QRK11317.1 hypothetical protein JQX13_15305 [Archangium violaceum]